MSEMSNFSRITCSALLSVCITAALFLAMLGLVGRHQRPATISEPDLTINHINLEEETRIRKRHKKKPPEKPKSTQPPAAPKLDVIKNQQIRLDVPHDFAYSKNINLLKQTSIPGFSMDAHEIRFNDQGGVKAGIPPVYPPKAVLNNIEGWVLVAISINETGQVEDVKVLDAEPSRMFEEEAIKSVRKWSFYPKTEHGQPVPYEFKQKVEFRIEQLVEEE